jgi:hypothetical protein
MFTVGEVNENKVLTLRIGGKLTLEEYQQAIPQCEALLNQYGRLRFYVDLTDFSGFDVSALWEGLKFDIKHYKQYERSVIVGDKKWEEWAVKFSGLLFHVPVRFFYPQDAQKAWEWVNKEENDLITIENISGNIVKVTVPETLKADAFAQIALQADALIQQHGKIRLLVDASNFNGWKNITAFERHMGFVKSHHQKIERGALIAGHAWQHWVAGIIRIFVHPEIRMYDKNQEQEALQWLNNP